MDGIIPSDPTSSKKKVMTWGRVKVAKHTLAEAYKRNLTKKNMDKAIILYKSLINLALRA